MPDICVQSGHSTRATSSSTGCPSAPMVTTRASANEQITICEPGPNGPAPAACGSIKVIASCAAIHSSAGNIRIRPYRRRRMVCPASFVPEPEPASRVRPAPFAAARRTLAWVRPDCAFDNGRTCDNSAKRPHRTIPAPSGPVLYRG